MRQFCFVLAVAMLCSVASFSHAAANLLDNGDFEAGVTDPWNTYGDVTISLSNDAVIGKQSLYVKVNTVGTNFWDSGLQHAGHVFQPGTYTLSAWLKGEDTREINFKPELGADPWTGYGEQGMTMTNTWQEYHTTAVIPEVVDPGTITFHIAHSTAGFWIDNVRWVEGEFVPSSPSTAVEPVGKLAATWAQVKSL